MPLGISHDFIDGVDQEVLDSMVMMGLAEKTALGGYALNEAGEKWLRNWCADQLAKYGTLQMPLDGMNGKWLLITDPEVIDTLNDIGALELD